VLARRGVTIPVNILSIHIPSSILSRARQQLNVIITWNDAKQRCSIRSHILLGLMVRRCFHEAPMAGVDIDRERLLGLHIHVSRYESCGIIV